MAPASSSKRAWAAASPSSPPSGAILRGNASRNLRDHQRHHQLHPHPHGPGGRQLCRCPRRRPASRLCRSRPHQRRRGLSTPPTSWRSWPASAFKTRVDPHCRPSRRHLAASKPATSNTPRNSATRSSWSPGPSAYPRGILARVVPDSPPPRPSPGHASTVSSTPSRSIADRSVASPSRVPAPVPAPRPAPSSPMSSSSPGSWPRGLPASCPR